VFLFSRFILRQAARDPLRTLVTVGGVALGVAVVVAVRMANDSSVRGFSAALEAMSGRAGLEVLGSAAGVPETTLAGLGWLRDYGSASPVIEGDAIARVPATRPAGETARRAEHGAARADGTGTERDAGLVRILGIDILRDRALRDYNLLDLSGTNRQPTSQEFLALLSEPRAVVVTARFAARHGLAVGDGFSLVVDDTVRPVVVRGLLRDEGPGRALDGNLMVMDIAAAQWMFGRIGWVDRVELRLDDEARIAQTLDAVAARLPGGLSVQRPSRRGEQVERMLAAFHLNLTALSLVALLVGVFLVYNTIAVSVVSRREEIGALRALGVTRAQVLGLFLGEATAVAVCGTALGLLLGRALAWGALTLTSATVSTLYVATAAAPPALGADHVLLGVIVGLPLSLAAAAVPAREAARVSPLAALRGADRLDSRYRAPVRSVVVALGLLALAAWCARRDPVGGLPLGGYAAAFALVFAAAFLVPAVLYVLGRSGRVLLPPVFGVEGLLANSNLAGAIPRLAVSVAALSVALAMMVAITIMVASFRETVVYWVGQTLQADLYVGPATRNRGVRVASLSPEVEAIATAHPAVATIDRLRTLMVTLNGLPVQLNAHDVGTLARRGRLGFKAPAGAGAGSIAAIAGRDEVLVSESLSVKHRLGVGDHVRLPVAHGETSFLIAGVFYDYSSDRGVIVMDAATFARAFGDRPPSGLALYLRPGADAEDVRAAIGAALPRDRRVQLYTNAGLRQEVLRIFDATFTITYALQLVAIVVAMMGVAGTLVTLVIERRRELAVLRLIGADRRQVRRLVVIEAVLLGAVSQGLGLVVGTLLSLVLIYVINLQSFGWTIRFHLPVASLALMNVLVLAATALAGLYPAHRASRLRVVDQVAEE
jgi:putative ABC transport system permease protein